MLFLFVYENDSCCDVFVVCVVVYLKLGTLGDVLCCHLNPFLDVYSSYFLLNLCQYLLYFIWFSFLIVLNTFLIFLFFSFYLFIDAWFLLITFFHCVSLCVGYCQFVFSVTISSPPLTDQHHAEWDSAGCCSAWASLALQQCPRKAALRGDAEGHPPLQGALQDRGGAGSGSWKRRGWAAADPGRHGRLCPWCHQPLHGRCSCPHQDKRPPPLLDRGGGRGVAALRRGTTCPCGAPYPLPLWPVSQTASEPVSLEPPAQARGGEWGWFWWRYPPVDQRSQGEPGRRRGYDPAGQPRPGGGDSGAWARLRTGQVLHPVGHHL